jgi:hypothetical protein
MANTFIAVNPTANRTAQISQLVGALQNSVNLAQQILADMNNMIAAGPSYTPIETFYALPAGTGQTMYNYIAGLVGASEPLVSANVSQFLANVG